MSDVNNILNADTDYLAELNNQQRDAVVYLDGPSLVIAGAGSGKTRVLTYKIVHLLSHGFEPWRVMALTFTNKAAKEMKERVAAAVGEKLASRLWMGTFHSVFLRILRAHTDLLGYGRNFTIYDASDSQNLIKAIIKDLGLDDKAYKASTVASIISKAKNSLIGADQYASDPDIIAADKRAQRPMIYRIYQLYAERCKLADAMDFDDILFQMNLLLRDHPDVLRHYQEFFRYILVDEYQDTNFSQHLIISQLSKAYGNICVVGDDAQSIYSFRGANISNILNLNRSYPNLSIFKLERNYRSTQNIINAAGSLIAKNSRQIPKNVFSENLPGDKIEVIGAYRDLEESFIVANKISQSKLLYHDSYDDYAVLYRTNAQSRILEESLRKRNIPYRIYGGLSFYQRKEVKDAISYFRLAVNQDDDESLKRIINYPTRGIGDTTMKKVRAAAFEAKVSMMEVISNPSAYALSVNSGTLRKLDAFRSMIVEFSAQVHNGTDAYTLALNIYNRTGMLSVLAHDHTPEAISRQENLKELLTGLKEFVDTRYEMGETDVSMQSFLSEVSLASDQDAEEQTDEPKVTLMTVHAAKGLEFSNIYVVGVEEDLFPSAMSQDSLEEIEEERRLLYVAVTRAKLRCTLTYAKSRFRNGATQTTRPSRFLRDIDSKYLMITGSSSINAYEGRSFVNPIENYRASTYGQSSFTRFDSSNIRNNDNVSLRTNSRRRDLKPLMSARGKVSTYSLSELKEGVRIKHDRFGLGTIKGLENADADAVVIVDFENIGEKKLLLRFAKFEILK